MKLNTKLKKKLYSLGKIKTPYHKMRHPKSGDLVYVHRFIMEKKLGRKLRPNEVVDHINMNKNDNKACNLRLRKKDGHSRTHYKNGHYHKLTKKEMQKGAKVTNKKLYGK